MKKVLLILPALLLAGILFYACQDANVVETLDSPTRLFLEYTPTGSDVVPVYYPKATEVGEGVIVTGDAASECSQVGDCGMFANKWNEDPDGEEVQPIGEIPEGSPNGTITFPDGNIIVISNSNGYTFDWSSEYPVCKILVKAGQGYLVYSYPDGAYSDQGLYAPEEKEVSHITFCYNEPDEEECFECETGFGGETAGSGKSWWFVFNGVGEQIIWAGKTMEAGKVTYEDGKIIITLNEDWSLQEYKMDKYCQVILNENEEPIPYDEPVKIEIFETVPSERPAAGLFTYKSMSKEVSVPSANFYVIHLDLLHKVPCE